jgi:hypothetical protein
MATQEDVRRIALSLPQASEAADHLGFGVPNKGKLKGFAWAWNERIEPKKPRVPNPDVLVVRVANLAEKEELLSADPEKFFTERTTTVSRRCWCGSRPSTSANSRS